MGYGITGFGAHIPRLRMSRAHIAAAHAWMAPSLKGLAKGVRSFCNWDEDAVTMAVEAGRDALAGRPRDITSLRLASTTLPYADLQASAIAAAALGLDTELHAIDLANSQRVATSALIEALRGGGGNVLLIASDHPTGKPASTQEMTYGAGAAALVLGSEGVMAHCLGSASITEAFVDHFRAAGDAHDYVWEERWIRDEGHLGIVPRAISAALANAGVAIGDIRHFVMPAPNRGASDAVARKVGFTGSMADALDADCGYAGAAHALLMLVGVLERAGPGEKILLVGFGQGCDALVLETTDAIGRTKPSRGLSEARADALVTDSYLRMLSFQDGIDLEWGMRAEKPGKTALTEQYRSRKQIMGFQAGRCRACGTIQFPQLPYCVDASCNAPATQFETHPLVDEPAKVLTMTADWLSYHPSPPLHVGFVQFANGARLLMEVVDVGPEGVEIGTDLRMVFRIKERDRQRHYDRYFWKATPLRAG